MTTNMSRFGVVMGVATVAAVFAAIVPAAASVREPAMARPGVQVHLWLPAIPWQGEPGPRTPSPTPSRTPPVTASATATVTPDPDVPASRPDRLLSTGQGWGYRLNQGLPADGNRDDGDLIHGRVRDYEHADGDEPATQLDNVVVDRQTGLMWIRDAGLLDGSDSHGVAGNVDMTEALSWQAALDRCNDLVYAGDDDWRLPNLKEMRTLVDYGRSQPAIDAEAFPQPLHHYVSPYMWTSTTYDAEPQRAFYVNFLNGHTYPFGKAVPLWARPVRTVIVDGPVAIMRTGQTAGYTGNAGAPGAGSGDDGDLQRGLGQWYEYTDDGTVDTPAKNVVVDLNTNLVWIRDMSLISGEGGVHGDWALDVALDWQTALDRTNALSYAGHDDWRLPNIVELESIAQAGRDDGRLFDPAAFPNAGVVGGSGSTIVWWSSTTSAFDRSELEPGRDAAWYLTGIGATNVIDDDQRPAKARLAYVRPVRDREPRTRPPLYAEEVRSSAEWGSISIASPRPDLLREGKFIVGAAGGAGPDEMPGAGDSPFLSAYQDVNLHPLHYEFLLAAFPDRFAGLSPTEYTDLVSRRDTRKYFAGGLKTFLDAEGRIVYGFDVYTDPTEPDELLTEDETLSLYRRLSRTFRRRPFVYSPSRPAEIARAGTWGSTTLPIGYPAEPVDPDYEAYTTGQAYGYVRRLTVAQLDEAAAAGQLSHQDIVVVDGVPIDIEGVTAGIVTGDRQGALSHLGVRTARRGTPNAFVRDSHQALAAYEGRLVRLSVTRSRYVVETDVSMAEAQAWWLAVRPSAVPIGAVDARHGELDDLATIGTDDQEGQATTRFGGKAANLARLYTFLPPENQVPGFAIPFRYYLEFISDNTIADAGASPPTERTYAEHIGALHDDTEFRSDAADRAALLESLRDAMRDDGQVSEALVEALARRIDAVFGEGVMVRFRSSSNAEDGLVFNGAGLYDSTSVCVADSLDDDTRGPSRCDPDQPKERAIERGLKKVWASLWNARAWEEREYYGIDHLLTGMAVLVTTAFPDERANGVAFTGDPNRPESDDYIVSAQDGDVSVVYSGGVMPERSAITITDGRVTGVRRLQASSLMPPGEWVMSEEELRALGDLMVLADARYPVDTTEHDRDDILLDLEFKIRRGDNQLLIKQIRPFLKRVPGVSGQPVAVRVRAPEPMALCGTWREGYGLRRELDEQAVLQLNAADLELPSDSRAITHTLFGALAYGPDLEPAGPLGPGQALFEPEPGEGTDRRLVLSRTYGDDARAIDVALALTGMNKGGFDLRDLDGSSLTWHALVTAEVREAGSEDVTARLRLAPCGYEELALYRHDVELVDGGRLTLLQRLERDDGVTGQAALVEAEVELPEGRQTVTDFGRLVYAAERHHWNEQFLVLLEPPIGEAHGVVFYRDYAGAGEPTYRVELLDDRLETLQALRVANVRRTP